MDQYITFSVKAIDKKLLNFLQWLINFFSISTWSLVEADFKKFLHGIRKISNEDKPLRLTEYSRFRFFPYLFRIAKLTGAKGGGSAATGTLLRPSSLPGLCFPTVERQTCININLFLIKQQFANFARLIVNAWG
ncbi:MAG: hypothetical protein R2941_21535 [Desulfobacterales bacterium]